MFFRERPYFAHLAVTHRCNLRCRFCHIQEERMEELDLEGMKRVIDKLDRLGVAVLSISGGGEPLLRHDCIDIVNYAADKGMYTKITSNGTMSLAMYEELLGSKIKEIGISLDGVRGNDLPFSHVGPKILTSIRYLNDHLPAGKKLTLNITVSHSNRDQVDEIVAYCTREFPNARLWLNPVMVGSGRLRTNGEAKVNPDYLRRVNSPTLITAEFFKRGAEAQYQNETYDWGCLAGRFFFDIKPNGDFWMCQDFPSATPLNIMDPDFERKYHAADFSQRPDCSGCTYSCYFVTQRLFEPQNWPDMAAMWWKTATRPDDPCRDVAARHGWAAGLAYFLSTRALAAVKQPAAATMFLLLLLGCLPLLAQQAAAPLEPEQVIARMEECNASRAKALQAWRSLRRYEAGNQRLHRRGSALVEVSYVAPEQKDFRVLERDGSKIVWKHVIEPLMEAERNTARRRDRSETDICRRNYRFAFRRMDPERSAYVFYAEPVTPSKYLFRGELWIDSETFAISRIEGEPARSPSFWVRRTKFVHEYQRFGEFWFPVSNRSEAELRIFGVSRLSIDYYGYTWRGDAEPWAQVAR